MSLTSKLHKLRNTPEVVLDKKAVLLGKHKLLAEINRRQDSRDVVILTWAEAFRFMWLRFVRKIIPAERSVIAALLVITMTASTTYMAQAAVPGDLLWPVKLTYEKAELAFATDPAHEGRLHIKHVDNRLKELSVIVTKPNTVQKSKNISQLVRRLEKDITAADQSLKLATEEKRDTEPEVVIALAQDLSSKALEAVTVLEDNHTLLEASVTTGDATESETETASNASTTEALVEVGEGGTSSPTSSDTLVAPETPRQAATAAAKVVAEVQAINVEVSFSALKAMIEVVERAYVPVNREEITQLMAGKVVQLRQDLPALQEQVPLVNDDFILHRTELRSLSTKAEDTLDLASDFVDLDNLSGAYKKAIDAKDLMARMGMLLDEVRLGNGFKPKPQPVAPKVAPTPVTIQTVGDVDPAVPQDPVVTE